MDYIRGVLRGFHLLAHTWAGSPTARAFLFGSGTVKPPPMDNYGYYTMAGGGKSIETGYFLNIVILFGAIWVKTKCVSRGRVH